MSRSWTESAGIAIGRDHVAFSQISFTGKRWELKDRAEAKLPAPLFSGAPSPGARQGLAAALRSLGAGLERRFVPLHVSVPDAAVRVTTFELEELPKTHAARLELVRFRFARQGGEAAAACACQPLERDGAKQLLFGMALDEAWRRAVSEALEQAGLHAWSLSANGCRQFNRFHDELTQASGALLCAAPEAWSLWLWDELGRPRYVRARWRSGAGDHDEIAQEAERAILAYVHGAGGRSVARVFAAAGEDTPALGAVLDARLREPCTRLQAAPVPMTAALAAALER